jgi:hypothetical protein
MNPRVRLSAARSRSDAIKGSAVTPSRPSLFILLAALLLAALVGWVVATRPQNQVMLMAAGALLLALGSALAVSRHPGRRHILRRLVLEDVLSQVEGSKPADALASVPPGVVAVPASGERPPPTNGGSTEHPDTIVVPRDAWEKTLAQLGDLHRAESKLAAAQEGSAKAEAERDLLSARLRALQRRDEELKSAHEGPGPRRLPSERVSNDSKTPGSSQGEEVEVEWRTGPFPPPKQRLLWRWRRRT